MLTESWTTLLSIFALAPSILAATVTLTDLPAYQSQRGCAIPCFHIGYGGAGGPDQLADQLDCSVSPIENDCFCRADLQDDADALIQSCVYEACSGNTIDVSSAVSIYDSYCTAAGFTRAVETTAVQGISGTASSTSNGAHQTSPPPPSTSSSTPSSGDNKSTPSLSTAELAGIIVAVCGVIATIIGVWFSYRTLKNKRVAAAAAGAPHGPQSYMATSSLLSPGHQFLMGPVAYKSPMSSSSFQNSYHGFR